MPCILGYGLRDLNPPNPGYVFKMEQQSSLQNLTQIQVAAGGIQVHVDLPNPSILAKPTPVSRSFNCIIL